MKSRNLVLGSLVVVICAVIAGVSLGGSTKAAVAFAQVPTTRDRVEVYGKLDHSSIVQLRGHNMVEFRLVEEKTGKVLPVIYRNDATALPANFPAASHVRATGLYDSAERRFVADSAITKCPSKYDQKVALNPDQEKAIAAWGKGSASQPAQPGAY
ncbi:MAG TPA: cytochrome c maturation protein CcmE [Armatimonadota bacterium]|nr:cytochrome c maturation protein CcmE [Armatimonadota bacterium]